MTERAPRDVNYEAWLPAATALVNNTVDAGPVVESGNVANMSYTPQSAITGGNSPASRSIIVLNRKGDGTGTTEVGRIDFTSGVNAAADDEKNLTLSGTAANLVVNPGDVFEIQSTAVGGTGLADPGGLVKIDVHSGAS